MVVEETTIDIHPSEERPPEVPIAEAVPHGNSNLGECSMARCLRETVEFGRNKGPASTEENPKPMNEMSSRSSTKGVGARLLENHSFHLFSFQRFAVTSTFDLFE